MSLHIQLHARTLIFVQMHVWKTPSPALGVQWAVLALIADCSSYQSLGSPDAAAINFVLFNLSKQLIILLVCSFPHCTLDAVRLCSQGQSLVCQVERSRSPWCSTSSSSFFS